MDKEGSMHTRYLNNFQPALIRGCSDVFMGGRHHSTIYIMGINPLCCRLFGPIFTFAVLQFKF